MKNKKLILLLLVSVVAHALLLVATFKNESVEVVKSPVNFDGPVRSDVKIERNEIQNPDGWNTKSAKVSGGIYKSSSASLGIEPVLASRDHIITLNIGAIALVIFSAIFHCTVFLKTMPPTSR